MGKEIERKFLVKDSSYQSLAEGTYYHQGYIPTVNGMTVRVRIAGSRGYVTLKDRAVGFSRHEFEYEVPVEEARQMLELMCSRPLIEKFRYVIDADNGTLPDGTPVEHLHWEVDRFLGDNEGLVVAEIEVPDEATQIVLPDWVGVEVTGDKRYYNSHLCRNPFKNW